MSVIFNSCCSVLIKPRNSRWFKQVNDKNYRKKLDMIATGNQGTASYQTHKCFMSCKMKLHSYFYCFASFTGRGIYSIICP